MDVTNSKNLPVVRFRDGKIANIDEVFKGVRFGSPDRAGKRSRERSAWIEKEDAFVTGLDNHQVVWGEVSVGHGWSPEKYLCGCNSYYRIHPTKDSISEPVPYNFAAAGVDCVNP